MGLGLKVDSNTNSFFNTSSPAYGGSPGSGGGDISGAGSFWNAAKKKTSAPDWWAQNKPTVMAGLAGYSAISARNQAQGQRNMLGYAAQVSANQAAIAGYQAQISQQVGAAKEQDSRLQTAAQFGSARAHMAASGIDLGQGSATDVLASTEYMGERNAMMIRDDTNRQVWKYRNDQATYLADQQAKLAQRDAINPDMAAFTSLLGSAASFAASAN